jgi:thiaminase
MGESDQSPEDEPREETALPAETVAGVEATREHAADLIAAAKSLCEKFPHLAYHFAVLALEEIGRGVLLVVRDSYAAEWGISMVELEDERPTATTHAYSNFLLRVAALGDYGELAAALLPCIWGYHELAALLAERGRPSNQLYARWIDEYASAEFGGLTAWCRTLTDGAAETSDRRRMTDAFLTSSRYELAFWEASWREEPPLRERGTPSPTTRV